MKTEKKIIKLLIEKKKSMTIREIAKNIPADYRISHTAIQRLVSKGVISCEVIGKSKLCTLDRSYYGIEIYEAENERRDELLKIKNIKQLYREISEKIETTLFIFLIFGSYANGKQRANSDIDIMIISNEKALEEKILRILSLLPLKTHALVFSEEEFIRMKDSKTPNVVKEAINNNIILYNIEGYYKLKNA